jgi:pilus assembly protein CpaB
VLTSQTAAGQSSEVILANVRVLAIGHRLGEMGTTGGQEDPNTPAPTPTVFDSATIATLELLPAQADTLINAATAGQLSLTLRSVVDFNKQASAEGPNSSQTVRLIRFGKEQAVMAAKTIGEPTAQPVAFTPSPSPVASGDLTPAQSQMVPH